MNEPVTTTAKCLHCGDPIVINKYCRSKKYCGKRKCYRRAPPPVEERERICTHCHKPYIQTGFWARHNWPQKFCGAECRSLACRMKGSAPNKIKEPRPRPVKEKVREDVAPTKCKGMRGGAVANVCKTCKREFAIGTGWSTRYCRKECVPIRAPRVHKSRDCEKCGKAFTPRARFHRYCTPECLHAPKPRVPLEMKCATCGEPFSSLNRRKYCGRKCYPTQRGRVNVTLEDIANGDMEVLEGMRKDLEILLRGSSRKLSAVTQNSHFATASITTVATGSIERSSSTPAAASSRCTTVSTCSTVGVDRCRTSSTPTSGSALE